MFSFPHPEGSHDLSLHQGWGSPPLQTRVLVWTPLATHSLMRKFSIGIKYLIHIYTVHCGYGICSFTSLINTYNFMRNTRYSVWWKKLGRMGTWVSAVK